MRSLRAIFEPQSIKVPAPLQVSVTRWGQDPFAYGSYSSLPVGTLGGGEYDILAESLGGRVRPPLLLPLLPQPPLGGRAMQLSGATCPDARPAPLTGAVRGLSGVPAVG